MSSAPMAPSPPSVIKDRRLRFLIWQSISTVSVYLFSSLLHLRLGHFSLSDSLLSFLALHAFLLLLSSSFLLLLSPCPAPAASLPELSTTLRKSAFKWAIGGFPRPDFTVDSVSRAWRSLKSIFFLVVCVVAGIFSVVAACWDSDEGAYSLRLRGAVFGFMYGAYYLASKRWILKFPIIQRPLFYSFKKYFYSSFTSALKMSVRWFVYSFMLLLFLPAEFQIKGTIGRWLISQIRVLLGIFTFSFCWEISHHLLQVLHTRRCIFAPPQGSAAAETNPSKTLLEVLEQSPPKSLLQHLAYLDLCIVSENNTEQWRRAAFFEESGETYRQVIRACLRPLENFTSKLVEGLEGRYGDCSDLFLKQMSLPMDFHTYSKLNAAFDDYELCAWSSRSLAALTVCSRHKDRYKVAQLSSCNTAAVSTLLTALLAVEACLGKKTGGPSKQFLSPTSMKWETVEEQCELHNKAYAMADVLRASIYQIVSAFWVDMQASAKSMVLDKNWISEAKPLFGARSVLVQKLLDFLDYRAV
ncbi:Nucleoporin NDC1 [Rhynchospora pubera]|uniref:Nucleoporin NDC1 n=1 Tax=Rhynchospora pubera TaxID=906938 RepID=A0AAV8CM63_9POAL|nr:Nucleoporin NDC1 [Rhynchospora pubera]